MQILRIAFATAVAVAVIGMTLYSWDDLKGAVVNLRPGWVLAGFCFYISTYYARARRLQYLSQRRIALWPEGIYCTTIHGFATYMLPIRTGDLTLPVLLRFVSPITLSQGMAILYKARLLDVVTLGIWSVFAAIYPFWDVHALIRSALFLLGGVMIGAPALLRKFFLRSSSIDGFTGRLASNLSAVGKVHWSELFQSTGIWASLAVCFFCIAEAIGLSMNPGSVWLLIVIQMPLQLIPLQGLANSGNHEGGWVAGLTLLGFTAEAALEFALLSHAVLILYVLCIAPIALFAGLCFRRRRSQDGIRTD